MFPARSFALTLGTLIFGLWMAAAGARGESSQTVRSANSGDAYVLSCEGQWVGTSESLETVSDVRKRFSGDFLWVRRGGKAYLIRDRQVLEQARSLFAPLRESEPGRAALERRQAGLEAEQADLDREQEELDARIDALADDSEAADEEPARRNLEEDRRAFEKKAGALESRERELDAEERVLDAREEELETKAEQDLWRLIDETLSSGLAAKLDRS